MWPWKKKTTQLGFNARSKKKLEPKTRTEVGLHAFHKGIEFVLKWEGGYHHDPDDPGGETAFGISKKAYPHLNIAELTQAVAIKIYYKDYWLKAGCDKLPTPANIVLFDTAVNIGVSRALELAVAANNWQDILLARIKYYVTLAKKKWARKYLRGWLNRVMELTELCVRLK